MIFYTPNCGACGMEISMKIIKKVIFILLIAVIMKLFYKCPIACFFGISCPGCGMTRALIAAAQLDFERAFYYHPLFPLVIILIIAAGVIYVKKIQLSSRVKIIITVVLSAIFFSVYLYRLFHGSDIVKIDWEYTVWYKILN